MFVATILAILHKVASLRFQYTSVYVARELASTTACKKRKSLLRVVDTFITILSQYSFKFEKCSRILIKIQEFIF